MEEDSDLNSLQQLEKNEAKKASNEKEKIMEDVVVKKEPDPVVYTTDSGVILRKSAGPVPIMLAKDNDDLRRRLDKSEKIIAHEKLEKRASVLFKSIKGTPEQKAALLKAIETLDEKTKEWALQLIRSKNKILEKAHETIGFSQESDPFSGEFDELVETMVKKHPELSKSQTIANILDTDIGTELYEKSQ